jgi:16S rRNA (guanine1207-N2)-methyltransferase
MSEQHARRRQLGTILRDTLQGRLKSPLGILLGSPAEAADLAEKFEGHDIVCYQMDLHQAQRLDFALRERDLTARVVVSADLWDLSGLASLIYPVPQGGERALKLDMIEQAYHALAAHGILAILSPFAKEQFFPPALKKVFGKYHAPMAGGNAILWAQRDGARPRRRHEVAFQARLHSHTARFLSRPGVFSYGRLDDGARALLEAAAFVPGQRLLDLGCGCGTNGILAALARHKQGFTAFADSNTRAIALAELNARANEIGDFEAKASADAEGFPAHSFDVVLANPPYYGQMAIAERFIERGKELLKPGGTLYLVTKQVRQVEELLSEAFAAVSGAERRGYVVFQATS